MSLALVNHRDARALLLDDRLVVLALRTIGQGVAAEIGEVAALNRHGQVLLHTRIRPTRPCPSERTLPPLEVVWPTVAALLVNRIVASFHVADDRRMLRQTARRLGATLMYTEWRGVGTVSRRCTRQTHQIHPPCIALSEARTTLAVLRGLATPLTHDTPPPRIFWRYLR